MTVLKEYHPRVYAVQIGTDLDAACAAVNENRRAGDTHVWHNSNRIIISRKDGSFTAGAVGDWIVIRLFDGAVFSLSDEAFRADYKPMPSAA
jgi:hypothetical protein